MRRPAWFQAQESLARHDAALRRQGTELEQARLRCRQMAALTSVTDPALRENLRDLFVSLERGDERAGETRISRHRSVEGGNWAEGEAGDERRRTDTACGSSGKARDDAEDSATAWASSADGADGADSADGAGRLSRARRRAPYACPVPDLSLSDMSVCSLMLTTRAPLTLPALSPPLIIALDNGRYRNSPWR